MFLSRPSGLATINLLLSTALAQTFSDLPLAPPISNTSDACNDALNTTVSCPAILGTVSVDNAMLSSDDLQALCVQGCSQSLGSVRNAIKAACTAATDVIEFDGTTYPPTFVVDRFSYTYSLSCKKDAATNQFCDDIFRSWQADPYSAPNDTVQDCSDCILGLDQIQLNSPFGYDADFAELFSSQTASCGKTGYAFTTPAPYALTGSSTMAPSTTSASTPASTASCVATYTVQDGDTCNTVAQNNSVSTFDLLFTNGLSLDCNTFPDSGASLCIPAQCDTYTVSINDTCNSIIATQGGITSAQFLAWNPSVNSLCGNILDFVGDTICLSPPGGSLDHVVATTTLAVSTPVTATARPTNADADSKSQCGRWYTIQDGDYCDSVSVNQNIALQDFYFLNPEINANCTNLLLGLAYCVQAVGDISTYSGYPVTSQYITLTSAAYSTVTPNATQPYLLPEPTLDPDLPLASGTASDCYAYRNYQTYDDYTTANGSLDSTVNSCSYVASIYGVTVADLLKWNPSLSSSSCALQSGNSYCAVQSQSDIITTYTDANQCLQVNDTMPGTTPTCGCFATIHGYDNATYTCDDMADDYSITVDQLQNWNSWIGTDCDTGLYTNLAYNDERAVCIAVNASAPTSTAGPGPGSRTTSAGASMGPTQTGIVAGCSEYYTVQSGDSCASIDAAYGITFEQFYAWNPAVGSNCLNLWLGYAYCVAGPASTVSPSAAASPTTSTAPTRTGTASGCSTYYTVQSGDSCQKIEDTFAVTFQQLYNWNTNIGSNCESLWVGYSVCVAGGPS